MTPEQWQALRQSLVRKVQERFALQSLGKGVLLGGAIGGGTILAKGVIDSLYPPGSSYTAPVDMTVYRPDREKAKTRTRKAAELAKQAAFSLLASLPPAVRTPIEKMAADSPVHTATWVSSLLAGVPVGVIGAHKINNALKSYVRNRELVEAQSDYEKALQEYAEAGDQPRRIEKRAAMTDRAVKLARLAENCMIMSSKKADWSSALTQYALTLPAISGLVGGLYGFGNRWDSRQQKDLDIAERQINVARESVNPTFTIAKLKDPVDLDPKVEDEEEQLSRQEALRQSVEAALQDYRTDYL